MNNYVSSPAWPGIHAALPESVGHGRVFFVSPVTLSRQSCRRPLWLLGGKERRIMATMIPAGLAGRGGDYVSL